MRRKNGLEIIIQFEKLQRLQEPCYDTFLILHCWFVSERMLFRKFDITHYGVAFIEDMFMDIPPTSILVSHEAEESAWLLLLLGFFLYWTVFPCVKLWVFLSYALPSCDLQGWCGTNFLLSSNMPCTTSQKASQLWVFCLLCFCLNFFPTCRSLICSYCLLACNKSFFITNWLNVPFDFYGQDYEQQQNLNRFQGTHVTC